jgi:hypothetical protein
MKEIAQKILKELEVLASRYVSELKDRNDAGFAVLKFLLI